MVGLVKKNEKKEWCRDPGSNQGPSDLQSDALPTELSRRYTNGLNSNQITNQQNIINLFSNC
jgi:hypothetical protein